MKILLISPPFGEKGQMSKGLPIAPPVLEYLTGLTRSVRPDIEVELLDANKEHFSPESVDADLVGFTVLTPQSPWAYRMSDHLRSLGKKVVLGGIHVTALPDIDDLRVVVALHQEQARPRHIVDMTELAARRAAAPQLH